MLTSHQIQSYWFLFMMQYFRRIRELLCQLFSSNERPESISSSGSEPRLKHSYDVLYDSSRSIERSNDVYDREMNDGHHKNKKRLHSKLQETSPVIVDNKNGHLIYENGDILADRYQIINTIGEGTFGKVVSARSLKNLDQIAAVKIIRNDEKYQVQACLEVHVLEEINKKDPENKNLCIHMIDNFKFRGHICISFELFGLNLFDFMKLNDDQPYTIDQIRHISYQLCYAVRFLHRNELTHTDLKPENIIFVNSGYETLIDQQKSTYKMIKNTEIRLIDFGNATFDDQYHSSVVTTRYYRAPEVILKLGWGHSCDTWSIGCIIFELYKAFTLFLTNNDLQHLAIMQHVLGPIPYKMTSRSMTGYFHQGQLNWNKSNPADQNLLTNLHCLKKYIESEKKDHKLLFNLINKMLIYFPSQRITMEKALDHQFFVKLPDHQRLHDQDK